jgi:hypothetical protein
MNFACLKTQGNALWAGLVGLLVSLEAINPKAGAIN